MKDSIRISEKHGVNPAMTQCFWCGELKNELVLFGRVKNDLKAPRVVMFNYSPCDKCQEGFDQGITVIEASSEPTHKNQAVIQEGCYPTGRLVVIKEEAAERMFGELFEGDMAENVLRKRQCFMEPEVFEPLFGASIEESEGVNHG